MKDEEYQDVVAVRIERTAKKEREYFTAMSFIHGGGS